MDIRLPSPLVFDRQPPLEEYDGLIIRDFESSPTAWILADQEIVSPNKIVTGLGKLRAVDIAGPCWDMILLCAPDPPNLKLGGMTALRTTVGGPLYLRLICVKVSLIHHSIILPNRMIRLTNSRLSPIRGRAASFLDPAAFGAPHAASWIS
jgi:hypothetical protein